MKYLLLIYEAEAVWAGRSEAEKRDIISRHYVLNERLERNGVEFSAAPLEPTTTARSLRVRSGGQQVVDGPFAETKEQLAGYYLLDVADIETALEYAALIPAAEQGTIEVRPVADHSGLS